MHITWSVSEFSINVVFQFMNYKHAAKFMAHYYFA